MGYTIQAGETRPLLNPLTNAPIETATVTDPDGNPPPFTTAIASVHDVGGNLVCDGIAVGVQTFSLKSGGTIASHEVTVTAGSFDWTLGDPA